MSPRLFALLLITTTPAAAVAQSAMTQVRIALPPVKTAEPDDLGKPPKMNPVTLTSPETGGKGNFRQESICGCANGIRLWWR